VDLISALNDLVENHHSLAGIACSAGEFFKSLSDKERETFENVLNKRSVPIPHIAELLKKNGYTVATSALYKHRRKSCRCFK
jgi:hypothetical protein